ncbi:FUSC family protein [Sodalis sp. dw_96]|uniref:FUSC family protein n=1 Tax=Sodalis sp. dw_96 TaxID=2719794 RepID=UPI001BD24383|nr:FUSC family protein [Sodalis sp. dw_96]
MFSVKTCAAAILALFISLYANLDRPGWAVTTVFIASQPFSGATLSKSVYRFVGTLLGAVATVLMVPNLVQTPEMLSLAMAAWVSLCLYLSLQDRSPRSYIFMLAGYSAAFIGFPSVDTPFAIFDTAVSRVEEITLGVVCSSLVHSVIFPSSVRRAVIHRIDDWLRDTRLWCSELLNYGPSSPPQILSPQIKDTTFLSKVADYPLNVEALTAHIAYEGRSGRRSAKIIKELQENLALLLPILASIEERLAIAAGQGIPVPERIQLAFAAIISWLNRTDPRPTSDRLRQEFSDIDDLLAAEGVSWNSLLWSGVMVRLQELLKVVRTCEHLRSMINDDRYRAPRRRSPAVPHIDKGLAALSAFTAFISILAGCAFWIATGWSSGSSIPMIAAVACSFFATLDSPLPSMKVFAKYVVVSVVITMVYSSVLLPLANGLEMSALMLAPAFIALGLLIAAPSTGFIGMVLSTNIATLLNLNNIYLSDFPGLLNNSLATLVGIVLTMAIMSVFRARTPTWSGLRIMRAGLRDVQGCLRADLMRWPRLQRQAFVRRMLERVHVLMPRVKANALAGLALDGNLLAELRLGANILDLRRQRRQLPLSDAEAGSRLDALIADIGHYLSVRAHDLNVRPPLGLRENIDAVLNAVRKSAPSHRELLLTLVSIRIVLYPHAPCAVLNT